MRFAWARGIPAWDTIALLIAAKRSKMTQTFTELLGTDALPARPSRGRPGLTGRFESREALEAYVLASPDAFLPKGPSKVALDVGVSEYTVRNIVRWKGEALSTEPPVKPVKGRRLITGRFETREELEACILASPASYLSKGRLSVAQNTGVSEATVLNIVKVHRGPSGVKGANLRASIPGRFPTQKDLLERVWFYELVSKLNTSEIAKATGVSEGTVNKIVSKRIGYEAYLSR